MSQQYELCSQGPCWDGYVYVGPKPRTKGSCVKKNKICKTTKRKKNPKWVKCESKVNCSVKTKSKPKEEIIKPKNSQKLADYENCLPIAEKRNQKGQIKLCSRGYCTAKHGFEVYPSAYANGYATSVCMGKKPDLKGVKKSNPKYMDRIQMLRAKKKGPSNLQRWYQEQWVNVCEKGNGPGGFAVCGSGKGIDNPEDYPYCRAYYKQPGTTVVTAQELTKAEIKKMCKWKRSLPQGVDGKPTRIRLSENIRTRKKPANLKSNPQIGGFTINIPAAVRKEARLGIKLMNNGFNGGTKTGWNRAKQLSGNKIDIESLADMRTWFARHGPDARNGGTSYPGYCRWVEDEKPMNPGRGISKNGYRGAVAWLIWGGDAAYKWLKTKKIRSLLEREFPQRKRSPKGNNLNRRC